MVDVRVKSKAIPELVVATEPGEFIPHPGPVVKKKTGRQEEQAEFQEKIQRSTLCDARENLKSLRRIVFTHGGGKQGVTAERAA